MLKKGEVIKVNYNQSLVIGTIKEVGPDMRWIYIVDPVFMFPIRTSETGPISFKLQKDKSPIYFMGGNYFAAVLDMDDELFRKYKQEVSGLIVMPTSITPQ